MWKRGFHFSLYLSKFKFRDDLCTFKEFKKIKFCLYFFRYWTGSIWLKIYIFHLLHNQLLLDWILFCFEKCWHNQGHRRVVYLFKFIFPKMLLAKVSFFQATHINLACSMTVRTLIFMSFIDLCLNKYFLFLWLFECTWSYFKGRVSGQMVWQFLNALELLFPWKIKLSNFRFRLIFIFNKKELQSCQFAT